MSGIETATDALATEARVFARYLVGQEVPEALVTRYAAANRTIFTEPPDPRDAAVVAFARRHAWSVGPLDAASGVLRSGGPLRSKILVMAAILETTPEFADRFLPRSMGPFALMLRVGFAGLVAVLEAAAGVALYALAARSRA